MKTKHKNEKKGWVIRRAARGTVHWFSLESAIQHRPEIVQNLKQFFSFILHYFIREPTSFLFSLLLVTNRVELVRMHLPLVINPVQLVTIRLHLVTDHVQWVVLILQLVCLQKLLSMQGQPINVLMLIFLLVAYLLLVFYPD